MVTALSSLFNAVMVRRNATVHITTTSCSGDVTDAGHVATAAAAVVIRDVGVVGVDVIRVVTMTSCLCHGAAVAKVAV